MEIELRDLRYFLAVAQQESITKAAEYLFIAQGGCKSWKAN